MEKKLDTVVSFLTRVIMLSCVLHNDLLPELVLKRDIQMYRRSQAKLA